MITVTVTEKEVISIVHPTRVLIANIGLKGEKGDAGPAGATGAAGVTGPAGATGPAGPNHVTSSTTTDVNGLLKGNGATVGTANAADIKGAAGLATTTSDEAVTRFDGTSGNTQNSEIFIRDGRQMDLTGAASEPSAPSAGLLSLYTKSIAGRMMLKQKGPSGLDTALQPFLGGNGIVLILPNNGANITAIGGTSVNIGTVTTGAPSATNFKSSARHIVITSAATNPSQAGARANAAMVVRGDAAQVGGFFAVFTFSVSTTVVNQRLFTGLLGAAGVPSASIVPGSMLDALGVGWDSGDANLSIIHNDASGAATKINLGASFPANSTSNVYELVLFCPANGSAVEYRVTKLNDGTQATGTISSNMPGSTTALGWHAFLNNGATANTVALQLYKVYIETDY
jgi:hypothetical protein